MIVVTKEAQAKPHRWGLAAPHWCVVAILFLRQRPEPCDVGSQDMTGANMYALYVLHNAAICHHMIPGHHGGCQNHPRQNNPCRITLDNGV